MSDKTGLFGEYVKQLRESRGLTLSGAADKLGIPRQKLWDIENGIRYQAKVPRPLITKMALVYRVPVGVIQQATEVKIREGKVLSEHLAETRPIVTHALRIAGALVNESRAYTPELESGCVKVYDLLTDLQTRLDNAYAALYPNTQKHGGSK